jgi:hypothetical protein
MKILMLFAFMLMIPALALSDTCTYYGMRDSLISVPDCNEIDAGKTSVEYKPNKVALSLKYENELVYVWGHFDGIQIEDKGQSCYISLKSDDGNPFRQSNCWFYGRDKLKDLIDFKDGDVIQFVGIFESGINAPDFKDCTVVLSKVINE